MFGLLTGLAVLVAASVPGGTPPSPEADRNAEVLALERERFERLTVPVHIGGVGPFRFMIDTGAQATVLSNELADQLELYERRSATLIGMASRRTIMTVAVDGLELGERSFNIPIAPLVPRQNIGSADGILGVDSLQDQRVLLDFRDQTISVADAEALGGNSGYEIIVKAREKFGQLIITEARVNGVRTKVIVDTGAQGSVGNPALLERLRGRALDDTEMTDINGQQLTSKVRVAQKLQLGRVQLRNFPIAFADAPPFHALGLTDEPALVLGMRELRFFKRVAIDFKTRRVLFDLPRGMGDLDVLHRQTWGV